MSDPTSLTAGQRDALFDLGMIEAEGGGLRVEGWRADRGWLEVTVVLDCRAIRDESVAGGLPVREREVVEIHVPPGYPLRPPSLGVSHSRFAGYENAMRGGGLCVFRAPDVEWSPSDGMAVFVRDRVWGWLLRAARGEVERQNGALHAPVLHDLGRYRDVVRYDAPEPETDGLWVGFVGLRHLGSAGYEQSERSWDRWVLTRWEDRVRVHRAGELWGAALLLPDRGGFYFPETLSGLLDVAEESGLGRRQAVEHLGAAAQLQPDGFPLVVVVGTPMGTGHPGRHHLTTVSLGVDASRRLRRAGGTVRKAEAVDAVLDSAAETPLKAFFSRDARRGFVRRRDRASPADWFRGKTVAVWGVGALGGPLAIQIARAGADRLILRDRGYVHHGLLVRQPYVTGDEEVLKVDALRRRLRGVRSGIAVDVSSGDLRGDLSELEEWAGGVDLVVNAAASVSVRAALDLARAKAEAWGTPVLTVGVDGMAERAFARLLPPGVALSNEELERDALAAVSGQDDLRSYADAFGRSDDGDPFYPEPGCSDATFVGSAADMAALSGGVLNWAARALAVGSEEDGLALFTAQPHVALADETPAAHVVRATARTTLADGRGAYRVRLSEKAEDQIREHVAAAATRNGPASETGGPLWGACDDVRRVVWIDAAGPAPPGSTESPDCFVCEVSGLAEETERRAAETGGAVGFVGTWHTHPSCAPTPSARDEASMADVCTRAEPLPRRFVMLIVGSPHADRPVLRPYVYQRDEYAATPSP